MKQKFFAMLLALSMAVSIVPAPALAYTTGETMENGKVVRNVEQDIDGYRQDVLASLNMTYNESVLSRQYYCGPVWKELNTVYKAERKRILSATKLSQLIDLSLQDAVRQYYTAANRIQVLGSLTIQRVQSKKDLNRLRKDLKANLKDIRSNYRRKDYNAYYWDIFQDKDAELSSAINRVLTKNTFVAYADAYYALQELSYDAGDDDDFDFDISIEDNLEDEDETDPYYSPDFLGQWIYTKNELEEIRSGMVEGVNAYVTKGLKAQGYKGSTAKFDSILDKFESDVNRIQVAETLAERYEKVIKTIDAKAKLKRNQNPPTVANIIRMQDKMTALYLRNYKEKNYSASGWMDLETVYTSALYEVQELTQASRLNNGLLTKLKKKLDKVPTLKQELAKAKKDAIAELKAYRKNPRYNQKKVKPIVKKGIAAIKRCKTVEQVSAVSGKYVAKAEKTVRKFKVRVRKKGKGKVTKSAVVEYGDSYTVTLTPKAGHRIKKVTINGKRRKLRNSYTLKNIRRNYKIKVIFR